MSEIVHEAGSIFLVVVNGIVCVLLIARGVPAARRLRTKYRKDN